MFKRKSVFSVLIFTLFLCFNLVSCGGGDSGTPPPSYHKMFITSATGTGDLSTWPAYLASGSSAIGIAAGDAICQKLATDAGLSGTYKAWLSTSTVDAYCHIQGYEDTIANSCGQGTLPVAAGPWVRTDGNPFADTIDKLVNNEQVFTPLKYDEHGSLVTGAVIFTGTNPDGALSTGYYPASPYSCSDWTDSDINYYSAVGSSSGATTWWTNTGGGSCGDTNHLICMQTGTGPALPARTIPAGAKRVFVTADYHPADLSSWSGASGSGITAGDAICQSRAAASPLSIPNPAKFKAWLSDGSTNAKDRFALTAGPWYRLDGIKVADSIADLTDGTIFTAISYSDQGTYLGWYAAWTGTDASGIKTANNCNNWGNGTSGNGHIGSTSETSTGWTSEYDYGCNNGGVLYCFEDN
jgi:hypothetical protein